MSWVTAEHPAGHERLIQLFIYNYGRPFPDYLDFRPILSGFAIVIVRHANAQRRCRGCASWASTRCSAAPSGSRPGRSNVYLIDLSPHWGQRELIKRYYEERASDKEPLIAWQMNWKGENIYTGNRVHVYRPARQQGDHLVDGRAQGHDALTSCSSTLACPASSA